MAYLLDADWVINALAGRRDTVEVLRRLSPEGIAISWVTVGEVYEGAFAFSNPQERLISFRRFLSPFRILSLDEPIVERFAETRFFLRRRGETIPDFDVLLGATALQYDLTVLTYNVRHLARIPFLKLYHS